MDRLSPQERSLLMAKVRSKDTAPERLVRSVLHRLGLRFRIHRADLPGKPDIVLPKHKTAIFVHGCFWHGHPGCRRAALPITRADFWKAKIAKNAERDSVAFASLVAQGYRVIVFWECELRPKVHVTNMIRARVGDLLRAETISTERPNPPQG
ncbi:MAG: very short patch repair endonuclease [Nitrospira sp.]